MLKVRDKKLAVDKFPGEVIIVDFETGTYYSLQGGASAIWELLEQGVSKNEALDVFQAITEEQKNEIQAFISDLGDLNLIEEVSSNSSKAFPKMEFQEIIIEKYTDMEDLIMLDPIHEVDERGWPHRKEND